MNNNKRVLIVEDDHILALALESLVEAAGHLVVGPFRDLTNGLGAAETLDIDVALLDFELGGKTDSIPIAEVLARREIPFSFVTGVSQEVIAERYGPANVISKPWSERLLLSAL